MNGCGAKGIGVGRVLALGAFLSAAAMGCMESRTTRCGDFICPTGMVCVPSGDACVLPEQLEACDARAEDEECSFAETSGRCRSGVCTVARCGDGVLEGTEDCESGDLADTTCADLGYYEASGLACTSFCTFDVSGCSGFCGDRALDDSEGQEFCDGKAPTNLDCADYGFDEGALGCGGLCTPDFSLCRDSTTQLDLDGSWPRGVWGTGPDDVFAVTESGNVFRYDGRAWKGIYAGSSQLGDVWGTSTSDVFIVGNDGFVAHFDGTTFSPMVSGTSEHLRSVWGSGPDDVFAVGEAGTIIHYDGDGWMPMESMASDGLEDVWGTGPANVYAVGRNGEAVRYNGSFWATFDPGVDTWWNGIWGSAADDIFLVGDSGTLLHYDGSSGWTPMTSNSTQELWAIWGSGPADVYVAGSGGDIVHYDGNVWSPIPSGVSGSFVRIWGSGPGDVYVVGGSRVHLGPRWESVELGTSVRLSGAWVGDDGTVVAAGGDCCPSLFHFDGETWSHAQPAVDVSFADVWGSSPNDIFAVGGLGAIVHYDGNSWQPMTSNTSKSLYSVWGTSSTNVFAAGSDGTVMRFNGTSWSSMAGTGTNTLWSVWGLGADDVYAAGDQGTLLHYDGSGWESIPTGEIDQIQDVWGTSPDNLYLASSSGLLHFDGNAFSRVISDVPLHSISGTGPSNVIAVGSSGLILRFDGLGWSKMNSGTAQALRAIEVHDDGAVAVGWGGTFLNRWTACTSAEVDCSDERDDDCDGYADCADPDCSDESACALPLQEISCGATVTGSTVQGTRLFDRYACSEWLELGREVVYEWTASAHGSATATLTGMEKDLDLVVTRKVPGASCNPSRPDCVGASSTTGDESLTFDVESGTTYCIAVEGFAVNADDYQLSLACP